MTSDASELLCESYFPLPKIGIFSPVFILYLLSQAFSAKTKCKFEFPDYSSCGLIMSKLNQSVHAFLIRAVTEVKLSIEK